MNDFKYELSIALIVKNEATVLPRCLRSLQKLRDAIPCQLIITDTGSTDGTIEIAKEFADTYLEFEWCNDFSAARNTGVEASEGRWFAYFDADEFLDADCEDIIEFFKNPEHNEYSCLEFERYDYNDTSFTKYDSITLHRFMNFSDGKKLFIDKIHEQQVYTAYKVFSSKTILHHTGYVGAALAKKIARNNEYLYAAIEKDPLHVRSYLHLGVSIESAEARIELFEKCLSYVKDIKRPKYRKYLPALSLLTELYYNKIYYDKLDKLVSKYIESSEENISPNLDILFYLANSKHKRGDFQSAIKYFERYQAVYLALQENKDPEFYFMHYFKSRNEQSYYSSHFNLANCYRLSNDRQSAHRAIMKCNPMEHFVNKKPVLLAEFIKNMFHLNRYDEIRNAYDKFSSEEESRKYTILLLEPYLNPVIYSPYAVECIDAFTENITDAYVALLKLKNVNFSLSKLDNSVVDIIKSDDLIYKSPFFSDLLYYTLINKKDIFELIENCSIEQSGENIRRVYTTYADYPVFVMEYMSSLDLSEITSTKMINFVKNLAHIYLINLDNVHKCIGFSNQDVLFMTDIYVKLSMELMENSYDLEKVQKNPELLTPDLTAVFYLNEADINIDGDRLEYVKLVKKALSYDKSLYRCIQILISEMENRPLENNEQQNEFAELAKQVKAQINALIEAGDFNSAQLILNQYSKINPTDKDIAELAKKIKA